MLYSKDLKKLSLGNMIEGQMKSVDKNSIGNIVLELIEVEEVKQCRVICSIMLYSIKENKSEQITFGVACYKKIGTHETLTNEDKLQLSKGVKETSEFMKKQNA